jgi:hypothetical protein
MNQRQFVCMSTQTSDLRLRLAVLRAISGTMPAWKMKLPLNSRKRLSLPARKLSNLSPKSILAWMSRSFAIPIALKWPSLIRETQHRPSVWTRSRDSWRPAVAHPVSRLSSVASIGFSTKRKAPSRLRDSQNTSARALQADRPLPRARKPDRFACPAFLYHIEGLSVGYIFSANVLRRISDAI